MSSFHLALVSISAFVLAAFFAGSETAVIATDRIRIRHLARKGDRRAKLLLKYIRDPEYFFSTVLVGTNLGMIGCTTTFTAIMIRYFGDSGATLATAILVPSLLIFQEILPKGVFLYYADSAAIASILPLRFFAGVLYPVIRSLSELTNRLARIMGVKKRDRRSSMTMEELLFHLRGSGAAGLISNDTLALATRAVDMIDFTAKDVMLPLDRVVMVEDGLNTEAYQRVVAHERFSRFPVYRGDRRNVVGFLSIRNLLSARLSKTEPLKLEDPYVVHEGTPIVEVLIRMKNQGCHMAMISDADTLIGMTTLEDILERLVGAIADEFH